MPVRRDSEGNIIERATRPVLRDTPLRDDDGRPQDPGAAATSPLRGAPGAAATSPVRGDAVGDRYGARTRVRSNAPAAEDDAENRSHTRIYRPQRAVPSEPPTPAASESAPRDSDAMDDPPVGWLVIVDGPGKGHVARLGVGTNSIGRDPAQRVSLSYGDEMISRAGHAVVTYDPRGNRFYIQQGSGTNLIYIDDQPVLAVRKLDPLTHVTIGNTVVRFVPLCGEHFRWDESPES